MESSVEPSRQDQPEWSVAAGFVDLDDAEVYAGAVLGLLQTASAQASSGYVPVEHSVVVTPAEWNLGTVHGESLSGPVDASRITNTETLSRLFQQDGNETDVRTVLVTVVLRCEKAT